MPLRLAASTGLALLGVLLLALYAIGGFLPPFLFSSVLICSLILLIIFRYGLISIPFVVIAACFVPALSFFWAYMNGAAYINMMNHWLQNDRFYVDSAVYFSAAALCFTCSVITYYKKSTFSQINITGEGQFLSRPLYVFFCFGTLLFVWLTEPSFSTIISVGSVFVKDRDLEGTQFAGALAIIFWLPAFVTYASKWRDESLLKKNHTDKRFDRIFVVTTLLSIAWLVLHARRNELIGMGVILLLVLQEAKGTRRAVGVGICFTIILAVIGQLRTSGLLAYFDDLGMAGSTDNVVSLPGGASNVFLTFVDTIHYFSLHTFLYGQTFINYVLQIFPSFVYKMLSINHPEYFFQIVFVPNYGYNGGTYAGSVFYGNFGILGIGFFGIFVGLFIVIASRLVSSRKIGMQLIGLYMVAFIFRGFWYEMITLIKPITIVLIPAYLVFGALSNARRSRRIGPSP